MPTRRPQWRALRPKLEGLELRQMLSQTISGIELDGDRWVLHLVGPGDLRVVQQKDSSGNPVPLGQPGLIQEITIAGANPDQTRLIGKVTKGPNGDGKVFFQTMNELGGASEGRAGNLGLLAIDMPNFWLGQTDASATPAATPSITIKDGVKTLRFGGADTTYTPPGGTPLNTNNRSDSFTVNLGLPQTWGTSIIVDKVITDAQAGTSTGTQPGTPTQDSVTFSVAGRLNVFQANEIDGNTQFPSTGFIGGGGTIVESRPDTATGIIGQIGFVQVGGNATNFSVQTGDKISNFYIGGETNNVMMLAPGGSRNVLFGKGMDNVTLMTHYIDTLQANRGAIGSNVTADRNIGRVTIGGDVVNTNVLAGYNQGLATVFSTQQAPSTPPPAQAGGTISNVLIAGNVNESIFAASVDPFNGQYDVPEALLFPHGHISAKVEGTITNTTAAPSEPTKAFFSKTVNVSQGPVIPPSVPELPFPYPGRAPSGHRIVAGLQPTITRSQAQRSVATKSTATPAGPLRTLAARRQTTTPQATSKNNASKS